MSRGEQNYPYKTLGSHLKRLRERLQETLAEVSGAVEIDIDALNKIEQGTHVPSEDILLLLISHFGIKEDEATKLWELAEYDQQKLPITNMANDADGEVRQSVVMTSEEARVMYTDMVHVMVNNYGVIMNFMQSSGPGGQAMVVSRVGMSKEHARSVLEVLQKTLQAGEPKALPTPEAPKDKQSKN